MKCPACGYENKDGHSYCVKCRQPLADQAAQLKNDSDSKKKKMIIAAVSSALCLGLIGGGAYWYLNSRTENHTYKNVIENLNLKEDGEEYQILSDSILYREDGSELSGMSLLKDSTVLVKEISEPDEDGRIWGLVDHNYCIIEENDQKNLEKIKLEDSDAYKSGTVFEALETVPVYSFPSRLSKEDKSFSEGKTVKLTGFQKDQFGSLWAKTDGDIANWILIEDKNGGYFVPSKEEEEKKTAVSSSEFADPDDSYEDVSEPVYDSQPAEDSYYEPSVSSSEYILPYSSSNLLSYSDISGMSLQELNYARNEIYARHGRKFVSQELRDYFGSKSWYYPSIEPGAFSESVLSDVEIRNIELLKDREYSLNPSGYALY